MFNISLEAYEPRGEAPVDFSKKQKKKKKKDYTVLLRSFS